MKKSKFCECCGKEFVPKQHFKRTKFCSIRCSSIVVRKNKMLKVLEEKKEEYEEIAKRELPKTQTYSILKYEKDGVWAEKEDMFLYENANILECEFCGRKFIFSGKILRNRNFCSAAKSLMLNKQNMF